MWRTAKVGFEIETILADVQGGVLKKRIAIG